MEVRLSILLELESLRKMYDHAQYREADSMITAQA